MTGKITQTIKIFCTCIIGMSLFLSTGSLHNVAAFSIGISPTEISVDNLLPSSTYTQEFNISRDDSSVNQNVIVYMEDSEIQDWFTISPSSFTFQVGELEKKFQVTINVPQNAKIGKYDASIRVAYDKSSVTNGQVKIASGIRLTANLEVTNQREIKILIVKTFIEDTSPKDPLKTFITIKNDGNTLFKPTGATLRVYDLNANLVKTFQFTNFQEANPFTTDTIELREETHGLAPGTYNAELQIYDGRNLLYEDTLSFTVNPLSENDLPQTGSAIGNFFNSLFSGNNILNIVFGCLIIAIIFCIIAGVIYSRKNKKAP